MTSPHPPSDDADRAHVAQLFDGRASMADAVAQFLSDGLSAEEAALVVTSGEAWHAIAADLEARGVPLEHLLGNGRLVVRDAAQTLTRLMRGGHADRGRFSESIGTLVRQQASRGARLRIHGAMVDLLAAEGEFDAALELESLWNDLAAAQPFTLFCGYSAEHFGDPRSATALRAICHAHTRIRSNPRDMLATFLVDACIGQQQDR